jgi:hypothetical protein
MEHKLFPIKDYLGFPDRKNLSSHFFRAATGGSFFCFLSGKQLSSIGIL